MTSTDSTPIDTDKKIRSGIKQNINVGIIGAVSVGKSTLLNALFGNLFSDMHIKRTTALPQIYHELLDDKDAVGLDDIRHTNREKNSELMDESIKSALTIDDIKEVHWNVPKIYDLLDTALVGRTCLNIYDLPGANDSATKDVYYQYMENTFHKFDIVIFVIDVYSALNTSDELEILQFILKNIWNNQQTTISTELIVLINKCDDMEENKNGQWIPEDPELCEMVNQIKIIIGREEKKLCPNANITTLCISCEDAYVYRMYQKNPDCELDIKHVNKFGLNEFGKRNWDRMLIKEKEDHITKFFSNKNDVLNGVKYTGFLGLKKVLNKSLSVEKQLITFVNRQNYELKELSELYKKIDIHEELTKYNLLMENNDYMHVRGFGVVGTLANFTSSVRKFMDNYINWNCQYLKIPNIVDDEGGHNVYVMKTQLLFAHKTLKCGGVTNGIAAANEVLNFYILDEIKQTDTVVVDLVANFKELSANDYPNVKQLVIKTLSKICTYKLYTEDECSVMNCIEAFENDYKIVCNDKINILFDNFNILFVKNSVESDEKLNKLLTRYYIRTTSKFYNRIANIKQTISGSGIHRNSPNVVNIPEMSYDLIYFNIINCIEIYYPDHILDLDALCTKL
jgi:small GTP-binding protein